uniref:Uncharacterized protein n=1 Tax=Anguilla anguilla TaxID=7936 RepID=A0A0E9WXA3_ANGAN
MSDVVSVPFSLVMPQTVVRLFSRLQMGGSGTLLILKNATKKKKCSSLLLHVIDYSERKKGNRAPEETLKKGSVNI